MSGGDYCDVQVPDLHTPFVAPAYSDCKDCLLISSRISDSFRNKDYISIMNGDIIIKKCCSCEREFSVSGEARWAIEEEFNGKYFCKDCRSEVKCEFCSVLIYNPKKVGRNVLNRWICQTCASWPCERCGCRFKIYAQADFEEMMRSKITKHDDLKTFNKALRKRYCSTCSTVVANSLYGKTTYGGFKLNSNFGIAREQNIRSEY